MNNSQTRIQEFQELSKHRKIVTVTAHGTLIPGSSFHVPQNLYIVFISRPGYFVPLRTLRDSKMMDMFHSGFKMRQFIADRLPAKNMPGIVRAHIWNWKRHIYPPGSACPDMGLEMFDKTPTEWGNWYHKECGLRYLGSRFDPPAYFKGQSLQLKNLAPTVKSQSVLFVFGCRGDPGTYAGTMKAFNKYAHTGNNKIPQPMTYNLPPSSVVNAVRQHENFMARYMGKKRVRASIPTRTVKRKKTIHKSTSPTGNRRVPSLERMMSTLNLHKN
jgi:hypothetical protein